MNSKKLEINTIQKGNAIESHVTHLNLKMKEDNLPKNVPFQPMRPRNALVRSSLQDRKKLERQYKAKIYQKSNVGKASLIPINIEKEKQNREEKEEWMLDLQEIYDKIHQELQKLIKYQQQPENYSAKEKKIKVILSDDDTQGKEMTGNQRFKEVLERQMKETEAMMERLQSGGDDKKGASREGLILAKQFRSSLKELYSLMETVAVTQMQKIFAQNFEFVKKLRQLRSKQLLKEISNSKQRLEKVRLGNKLENVLLTQKSKYELAQNQDRAKKLNEYTKLKSKYPYDEDIKYEEPAFFKAGHEKSYEIKQILDNFEEADAAIKSRFESDVAFKSTMSSVKKEQKSKMKKKSDVYIPQDKESDEIELQRQLALNSACFNNQRQKVEQIFDKMNSIEGAKVDFDHKYKYIGLYFKERRSLNNLYLGDARLSNFLKNYEDQCKKIDNQRFKSHEEQNAQSMDSLNLVDLDFIEEIEHQGERAIPTITTSGPEKNQTALSKVNKINQEIQKRIAEEEHEEKLAQIKKLGVEQNQNFWDQLLEKPQVGKLGRRQVKQKAQTSHGARPPRPQQSENNTQREVTSREGDRIALSRESNNSQMYLTEPPMMLERDKQVWLEKQQRLILNAHPNNPILKIAFSENKQQMYATSTNFATTPVNNINDLVRRQYASTSHMDKRSNIKKVSTPNLNQVPDDNNFRETFFSNFFLFQDGSGSSSAQRSLANTTNFTIRYPTANQKERPNKKQIVQSYIE